METLQNVTEMIRNGEVPSEIYMAKIHEEAQKLKRNPLIDKIMNSKVREIYDLAYDKNGIQALGLNRSILSQDEGVKEVFDDQLEQTLLTGFNFVQALDEATETLLSIDGTRAGWSGLAIDAAELLAAVTGAVAVTAVFPGAGLIAGSVASGFGATLGSAAFRFGVYDERIGAKEFLARWGQSSAFTAGAMITGGALGNIIGQRLIKFTEKSSWHQNRVAIYLRRRAERLMSKGEKPEGIFLKIKNEFFEELTEDGMEALGRGMVDDDPVIGFLFMCLPSATRGARGKLLDNFDNLSLDGGNIQGRLRGNTLELNYDKAKESEVADFGI